MLKIATRSSAGAASAVKSMLTAGQGRVWLIPDASCQICGSAPLGGGYEIMLTEASVSPQGTHVAGLCLAACQTLATVESLVLANIM